MIKMGKGWRCPLGLAVVFLGSVNGIGYAGPMDLNGQLSVNETGAATYTIPIPVPPGTSGIEPQLALTYSSQTGNGLLGMGWSISGLSAVTRCPRTLAQDGVRGSVNYDGNDRYCLEGQRLIAISGAYGADGAEYRTERDSFSKIVSYGTAGNGPAWFKVWTKAGQVLEYGNTTDSRILAQGKTSARGWGINKSSDTKGNYLTYSYTVDAPNGDYIPNRIDYTGNAGTGLAPNASVRFIYQVRSDAVPLYFAGSLIKSTQRMAKVQTYVGADLVMEYRLAYASSTATGRSRLTSVTKCASDGSCLSPTQLSWLDHSNTLTNKGAAISGVYANWASATDRIWAMDVNGDGLSDIVLGPGTTGNWYVLRSTGSSFVDDGAWITGVYSSWAGTASRIRVMDVNGDGLTDIVLGPDDSGKWYVLRSTGTAFVDGGAWITGAYASWKGSADRIRVMDVNGDGLSDIVLGPDVSGKWYVLRSTGTSFVDDGAWISGVYSSWTGAASRIRVMDANGDGLSDIVMGPGSTGNWYVLRSTGSSFVDGGAWISNVYSGWTGSSDRIRVLDANGDGLPDIALGPDVSGKWYVLRSTGTSFVDDGAWISNAYANWQGATDRTRAMDVNGDGLSDIMLGPDANGKWYVLRSTGTSFVNDADWISGAYGNWDGSAPRIRQMDVDGDGLFDIVIGPDANGKWYYLGNNSPGDLLNGISNAMGAMETISYKPITNLSVYTKGSGATYPVIDIQSPMYVVSQSQLTGVGTTLTTTYQYGGLKADVSGRGLLGFNWQRATQGETQLTVRTDYRQDWPYLGLPSQIKKTITGGGGPNGQLSLVSNTYDCLNPADGAACSIVAGKRYFPYVSQSVESSWDLNGAALPVVTTTNQFDTWGNASQITVSSDDGYSKTTANQYDDDATKWYLGRLKRATVTSVTPPP
jgi:hypothetical protein